MAWRLVLSGGNTIESPATVNLFASGVIHPGGAVNFDWTGSSKTVQGFAYPASSASTFTSIFGVALDYAQGNSDTVVRVIPFASGQIWEVDCISAASTLQIGKRHALSNATTPERSRLLQNNSDDNSSANGIFLCIGVSSATTGSGKLLGIVQQVPRMSQNEPSLFF